MSNFSWFIFGVSRTQSMRISVYREYGWFHSHISIVCEYSQCSVVFLFSFAVCLFANKWEENPLKIKNLFIGKHRGGKAFWGKCQKYEQIWLIHLEDKWKLILKFSPWKFWRGIKFSEIQRIQQQSFRLNERTHEYHDVCVMLSTQRNATWFTVAKMLPVFLSLCTLFQSW